jgi:phospholipid/cholesterol/gamma-HCH transport system substrate-binding protein
VKVMGIDVGTVRDIEVDGTKIRVEMQIDDDVPLPADVRAAIVPLSLIGERNVVLFPPWRPGTERAGEGTVIPLERTQVPVEPDEALQAVTDLAEAVDPESVNKLVSGGAAALRGHGADLNSALEQTGRLASLLASQDDKLLAAAANVHELATILNQRESVLGTLLDDFATATQVLADERESIATFLSGLVELTEQGNALLDKYREQLPDDLAGLTRLAMVIQDNAGSVQQLVHALREISDGFTAAYEPLTGGVRIRGSGGPTVLATIQQLFTIFGLGIPPCIPIQVVC